MEAELTIIYILVGVGIFFALPSTIYTCMFLGIFCRGSHISLEKGNLKGTQYYPHIDRIRKDIVDAKKIPFESVVLKAKDGATLFGRYYNSSADKVILLVHGYHADAFNNFSTILKDFLSKGYGVLLIDQRAHGESGGKFTTLGIKEREDLLGWIDFLDAKKEIKNIIVYGISMGATTIGYACKDIKSCKVKCLIMEAGFTCFYDEFNDSLGKFFMRKWAINYVYLMAKNLLKVDIKESTLGSLAQNKIPTLFLHGSDDCEVDISFTERNFSSCASKKEKIIIEGAGHTLCYLVGGETLHQNVDEFIQNSIR